MLVQSQPAHVFDFCDRVFFFLRRSADRGVPSGHNRGSHGVLDSLMGYAAWRILSGENVFNSVADARRDEAFMACSLFVMDVQHASADACAFVLVACNR